MTTFAAVKFGFVTETFTPLPEWEGMDPADLFARELVDEWVVIDGLDPPPAYGWRYQDGTFTPPETFDDVKAMRAAMDKLADQLTKQ